MNAQNKVLLKFKSLGSLIIKSHLRGYAINPPEGMHGLLKTYKSHDSSI